jgi:hypothetical protein
MFDSNELRELAYIKADRYQRSGGAPTVNPPCPAIDGIVMF